MKPLASGLRAWAFPLIGLVGVATLVAGTALWWRFYRDVYAEELRAIQAAVDAGAAVKYRREGERSWRVAAAPGLPNQDPGDLDEWKTERSRTPWNAAVAGRVETVVPEVVASRQPASASLAGALLPTAVRDDLLRLPGLKSYGERLSDEQLEDAPKTGPDWHQPPPRGASVANLVKVANLALTREDALAEMPRGTPLSDAEREALGAKIVEAWSNAKPPNSYLIRASSMTSYVVPGPSFLPPTPGPSFLPTGKRRAEELISTTTLFDGERRAFLKRSLRSGRGMVAGVQLAAYADVQLSLFDGDRTYEIAVRDDAWRQIAAIDGDASLPDSVATELPDLPVPGPIPAFVDETDRDESQIDVLAHALERIGERGERIVAAERIDEASFRVELAPRSNFGTSDRSRDRTEAIVRADLDYAVERFVTRTELGIDDGAPEIARIEAIVRKLERTGDTVYARSVLSAAAELAPGEPIADEKELIRRGRSGSRSVTIVANPTIPEGTFDPAAYDQSPWPEPQPLPVVRTYRVAWGFGGLLLFVGVVGSAATRRASASAAAAREEAAPRERRRFKFRFGLATLFAFALLTISGAGALRAKREVVDREKAALAKLEGRLDFVRREPKFPWLFVSSESYPLDAPLRRLEIDYDGSNAEEIPQATFDELMRNPELERFTLRRDVLNGHGDPPYADALEAAEAALARSLPPFAGLESLHVSKWFDRTPDGEPMSDAERDAVTKRIARSWSDARKNFPQKSLFVEAPDGDAWRTVVTLRDGERSWSIAKPRNASDTAYKVRCEDGRFRYGFAILQNGFAEPSRAIDAVATERTTAGSRAPAIDELEQPRWAQSWDEPGFQLGRWADVAYRRPADPPFAFPRIVFERRPAFDAAAAELLPERAAEAVRIDATRVRIDFPRIATHAGAVTLDDVSIVIREDFDDAVERCEFSEEATFQEFLAAGVRRPRTGKRRTVAFNRLARRQGVVVPDETHFGYDDGETRQWWHYEYAYDFDPPIDERIFRSPSMDRLEPLPAPVVPGPFGWPHVTALLACGIFAYGLFRRVREGLHRRPPRAEGDTA